MSYILDSRINKIFNRDTLRSLGKKIEKIAIGSKTKAKTKFNICEIYTYSGKVDSDNIQLFNIFSNENQWRELLNEWLIDCHKIESISFNYANYFLKKNVDAKQSFYKITDMETHIIDDSNTIYMLTREEDIDASSFSCRDNYRKEVTTEWRARACSKSPIYISFIHNETLNKYYIKLWFNLDAQVDVVIETLNNK